MAAEEALKVPEAAVAASEAAAQAKVASDAAEAKAKSDAAAKAKAESDAAAKAKAESDAAKAKAASDAAAASKAAAEAEKAAAEAAVEAAAEVRVPPLLRRGAARSAATCCSTATPNVSCVATKQAAKVRKAAVFEKQKAVATKRVKEASPSSHTRRRPFPRRTNLCSLSQGFEKGGLSANFELAIDSRTNKPYPKRSKLTIAKTAWEELTGCTGSSYFRLKVGGVKIAKLLDIAVDDYNYIYSKKRMTYTLKAGARTADGILVSSGGL